jgi:hypothetical protein
VLLPDLYLNSVFANVFRVLLRFLPRQGVTLGQETHADDDQMMSGLEIFYVLDEKNLLGAMAELHL